MDAEALERAQHHVAEARDGRAAQRVDAALERARTEIESLAAASARLEGELPARVSDAIQDGLKREVSVMTRNLAEIRGLLNNAIHRLERLEDEVLGERNARIDDLALIVDLISTGWRSVDVRLAQLEVPPMRAAQVHVAPHEFASDARHVA
jgi:chromosome segregation ATPase